MRRVHSPIYIRYADHSWSFRVRWISGFQSTRPSWLSRRCRSSVAPLRASTTRTKDMGSSNVKTRSMRSNVRSPGSINICRNVPILLTDRTADEKDCCIDILHLRLNVGNQHVGTAEVYGRLGIPEVAGESHGSSCVGVGARANAPVAG